MPLKFDDFKQYLGRGQLASITVLYVVVIRKMTCGYETNLKLDANLLDRGRVNSIRQRPRLREPMSGVGKRLRFPSILISNETSPTSYARVDGATTIWVADPAHRKILDHDGGGKAIRH